MRLLFVLAFTFAIVPGFGDTLRLRSGKVVEGNYLGGSSRQVRFEVGDKIETYDVTDVIAIEFKSAPVTVAAEPATVSAPAAASPAAAATAPSTPAVSTTAASSGATGSEVAAGSEILVRMIDAVDSEKASVGQEFRASLDEAVMSGSQIVIPRNADVVIKLVEDKQAGRLSGRTELTLDVVSISVNGRPVDVHTRSVTQTSSSQTRKTGAMTGGGAALGAIIGAIAGGGKGAAIGAVSGAGAGAAVTVLTKGPTVRIPSETRLTFVLQDPIKI